MQTIPVNCLLDQAFRSRLTQQLLLEGHIRLQQFISAPVCAEIKSLYSQHKLFRSRVIMARHGFGQGEYQYFNQHMPSALKTLRSALYAALVPAANRLVASLGHDHRYPADCAEFLARCAAKQQDSNTVLLLKYTTGDYNRLHQDRYGPVWFPFQAVVQLDRPEVDFTGGEFILAESEYMRQTKLSIMPLEQGDLLIFAGFERPVTGRRGYKKCRLKHAVSPLRSGQRYALGIQFHNAN